jgi:hypothetical protein
MAARTCKPRSRAAYLRSDNREREIARGVLLLRKGCDSVRLSDVDLVFLAPGRPARRAWGFPFDRIGHPVLSVLPGVSGSPIRSDSGSPLTKASSAATGMILRRPTFRLGSSRCNTRVARVRVDSPNLRAASAIPTASTVSLWLMTMHFLSCNSFASIPYNWQWVLDTLDTLHSKQDRMSLGVVGV